ncbi:LpqB family beta-propeller domain-containing protein [Microbacterium sediminis]|uniref:LpqB family beta-propeller domain-containing protein n=1 Tax=Microbacterium sediminis TaxID=904291 RepID=UPI001071BADB|nr:LpqB family beta-propeller domain-containing protein [Microbacterium sediminis]QBR74631.1 hypothetical protein E3O41_09645 [Microbacterium sediminis]
MRRMIRAAAGLVTAALLLTACAGLPTSGPVNPGLAADEVPEDDFLYYPEGPAPEATPEQIVQGFVEAATSPAGDWATAREFLTADFADDWSPGTAVVIDVPSARVYDADRLESENVVSLRTQAVATVDARGSYVTSLTPTQVQEYRLEQRSDGEWRIAEAPEGIVLDRDYFPNVYSDYALYYYDATGRYLVPDVRWYPEASMRPSKLASELLFGPGARLQGAARTAFPEGTSLAEGGALIDDDGMADVALEGPRLGDVDAERISHMRTQLTATLAGLGAQTVRIRVGTAELSAEEFDPQPTRPDARALVLGGEELDGAFGFLEGGEIERIDGLSDAVEGFVGAFDGSPAPRSIAVSVDRSWALVHGADGIVRSVIADGSVHVLDERQGVIEPALDPDGYAWAVPASAPDELRVYASDGTVVLEADFPRTETVTSATVQSIAVSRDGTRMAMLVTAAGGTPLALIAPIVRDGEGVPTALGDASLLTVLDGPGIDVEWLDDTSVGIVAQDGAEREIIDQRIGGPGTRMSGPATSAGISTGTSGSPIRLLDANGVLYTRRVSAWVEAQPGIAVLATDVGAPTD